MHFIIGIINVTKAQLKTSSFSNGIFIRFFFNSHWSIKCIIVLYVCIHKYYTKKKYIFKFRNFHMNKSPDNLYYKRTININYKTKWLGIHF